jgi:hypothetical protein
LKCIEEQMGVRVLTIAVSHANTVPPLLADSDALIQNYRDSLGTPEATSALAALRASIATEEHALDLDLHLRGKSVDASDPASIVYAELASRVDIMNAEVLTLSDALLMEKYEKKFLMYPPTPVAGGAKPACSLVPLADGLRFDVSWTTSRHANRTELSESSFYARVTATPFRVQTAEQQSHSLTATGAMVDLPSIILLDISDADSSRVNHAAFEEMRLLYAGERVTPRQFAWFICFLSSHPSDLAFDIISGCFLDYSQKK